MAELTLICGENNTGKTYATYAVYGFLRSWRQILRFLLEHEIDTLLKGASQYRINLAAMFAGKVDDYLARMGKEYIGVLPRAFATESNVFEHTVCVPRTCQTTDFLTQPYQRRVQAGPSGKVLATLNKEADSAVLEVLLADAEVLQRPFGGLTDFIADAIADIVFAQHLPRVHIASAERTGAAIFRKELDMARTRMIKAINEIDSRELKRNPFKILQQIDADYAWPVEDNVDFVRQLEDIDKRTSSLSDLEPGKPTNFTFR
ncbi:MAG: ATP-binding protein, partial [Candidatus Accumulibacter sp.]|nr:ATP-binding protein [Accumulibacter sp.]